METPETERTTVRLQRCLDRVHDGDFNAQDEMIKVAWQRLLTLAEIVLRPYQIIIPNAEKEDIFQKAMVRFWKSMKKITPRDLRDFFSLAALQIRRTLVDTIRHEFGPLGVRTNELVQSQGDFTEQKADPVDPKSTPQDMEAWTEFHEQIGALPKPLGEVFELTWYHNLTQEEIAAVIGVCSKTVRSRWREACYQLYQRLNGNLPI